MLNQKGDFLQVFLTNKKNFKNKPLSPSISANPTV